MNNTLIQSFIFFLLLLVSCKDDTNSESTNHSQEPEIINKVLTNAIPPIISNDKKWRLKMFSTKKSEIELGSGESFSDFESREFYCLEIDQSKEDTFGTPYIQPYRQSTPSAHQRSLTVFVYDSLRYRYSLITEGYNFEKKQFQFFFSTDLFNEFDNEVNIALDYYSSNYGYPIDFNPFADSSALPVILFENISVNRIRESLNSNDENTPKANDEWFRLKNLEHILVGEKHRR